MGQCRGRCSHSVFPRNAPESRQWGPLPQPHFIQMQLLMENQALGKEEIDLKGNKCDIHWTSCSMFGTSMETTKILTFLLC